MPRIRTQWAAIAVVLLGLGASASAGAAEQAVTRYRVEQVFRLETTSAEALALPGRLQTEPVATSVEGRVRLVLEQRLEQSAAGQGSWRFTQVEVEGPRTEPADAENPDVERALALGLDWLRQLEGQEFTGAVSELPVVPLGEAAPGWLAVWLRWAQTGSFAGVEASPVVLASAADGEKAAGYDVRWLRSETRQALCHVQQARWTLPVEPAPGSVPAALAAEGVEARTHFAALSLEWVTQENPTLVYAERSGVRETFWTLEKVSKPELQELVFRLRFSVHVRVERLP